MRIYRGVLALVLSLAAWLGTGLNAFASPSNLAPGGLADGPGIWVNMWNYPSGDIDGYCQSLHARGVRNLFIQTSRSNTDAIAHPDELGAIIEACHHYKIRVVAWSFAELVNPIADADKLVAAAKFSSPRGQHIDAVAANLEKDLSICKVEPYSKHLREALGSSYPTVAVVYSPLNKAPQVAHIPWKLLDRYYTVLAPMNYWNSKYQHLDPYGYTISTIEKIRELVGRPDVEIHMIGDGMGTHSDSIGQFFRACQVAGATSASLYPNYKMTDEQMECISHYSDFFPVNSRFRLAAFREALQSGALESAKSDPAAPITRGQFYKLVAHQLQVVPNKEIGSGVLTEDQAAEMLHSIGALSLARLQIPRDMSPEQMLAAPIGAKEAFNVVAAVVSIKSNPAAAPHRRARADRWFVQPAYADSSADVTQKPLNYLDAAQIVVQAKAGVGAN